MMVLDTGGRLGVALEAGHAQLVEGGLHVDHALLRHVINWHGVLGDCLLHGISNEI